MFRTQPQIIKTWVCFPEAGRRQKEWNKKTGGTYSKFRFGIGAWVCFEKSNEEKIDESEWKGKKRRERPALCFEPNP